MLRKFVKRETGENAIAEALYLLRWFICSFCSFVYRMIKIVHGERVSTESYRTQNGDGIRWNAKWKNIYAIKRWIQWKIKHIKNKCTYEYDKTEKRLWRWAPASALASSTGNDSSNQNTIHYTPCITPSGYSTRTSIREPNE